MQRSPHTRRLQEMLRAGFGAGRPLLRGLRGGIGKSSVIYLVSVLHSIALGSVNLGIVFFLRDRFKATPMEVGIVTALFAIVYFIGCFLFRPLTRKLLPRVSLLISTLCSLVSISTMLIADSIVMVGGAMALFGGGVAFFWPPIMGWLSAGLEGRKLGGALGKFNFSWSIGLIVSPYLAGALSERDVRLPLLTGLGIVASITVIVLVVSVAVQSIRSDTHREPARSAEGSGVDTSSPLRFPSWIGLTGSYLLMGIFGVVFPIHARSNLGLAEGVIGAMLLVRGCASTAAFVGLGRISWWHHRAAPIVIAQLLLGVGCLILSGAQSIGMYLVVLPFLGVLMSLAYAESVFHGVTGAVERARRMAMHEALLVAGTVVGSLGGSYVFQFSSAKRMFLLTAALLGVAALLQIATIYWFRRRSSRITSA